MTIKNGPELAKTAAEGPSTRELVGKVFEKFSTTAAHQAMLTISRNPNPDNEEITQVEQTLAQYQEQTQKSKDTVAANYFAQYRDALHRDYPQAFIG